MPNSELTQWHVQRLEAIRKLENRFVDWYADVLKALPGTPLKKDLYQHIHAIQAILMASRTILHEDSGYYRTEEGDIKISQSTWNEVESDGG